MSPVIRGERRQLEGKAIVPREEGGRRARLRRDG